MQPSSLELKTNLNLHCSNTYNHMYRTISWLSCKPIAAEAQVQTQASPCGICGGQIGSEKDFSLGVFWFSPLRITLPLLHTDSSVTDTVQSSHLTVSLNLTCLKNVMYPTVMYVLEIHIQLLRMYSLPSVCNVTLICTYYLFLDFSTSYTLKNQPHFLLQQINVRKTKFSFGFLGVIS